MNRYLLIGLLGMLLGSCASPKKVVYFQEEEDVQIKKNLLNFEPEIQVGDILAINVSAIDAEAAIPFNLYETPMVGTMTANAKPITYLVDADGKINFPIIGKIEVKGLTTKETNEKLSTMVGEYINKPIINIRLTNFKVTVMGEVKAPGTFTIPNERVSILDALSLAGDLTIHGKRKSVMLIREQNGQRMFIDIDLTNKQLFDSPYFYLSQNDVIYVEPNKTKVNSSKIGPQTAVIISSVTLLISLIAIFSK